MSLSLKLYRIYLNFTTRFFLQAKETEKTTYDLVKIFHSTFNVKMPIEPTPLSKEDALIRASFIGEELVELLHASSSNKAELVDLFGKLVDKMEVSLAREFEKEFPKTEVERLTKQFDSLLDCDVFTNGSYTLIGLDPKQSMKEVFKANMAKLFEDGKPRYREGDGKILKPDGWQSPDDSIQSDVIRQIEEAKRVNFEAN